MRTSGSYTANLLGTIRSHLAGLHGYDVMALELIQNADDAKAADIDFDITDSGLVVRNSGRFVYCGDLSTGTCSFQDSRGYSCDYHRIIDVASGGKLAQGARNRVRDSGRRHEIGASRRSGGSRNHLP